MRHEPRQRELNVWRDPFEMGRPWSDVASLFNDFFSSRDWPGPRADSPPYPRIESYLEDGLLHIKADLPGVDPEDVQIDLDGNRLTLKGERKAGREDKNTNGYFHRELSYGAFSRSFVLPKGIDADKIAATAKNGTLEVTVPIPEAAAPKRVTVQVKADPDLKQAA